MQSAAKDVTRCLSTVSLSPDLLSKVSPDKSTLSLIGWLGDWLIGWLADWLSGIQQYYFLGEQVRRRAHRAPQFTSPVSIGLNGRSLSWYNLCTMLYHYGVTPRTISLSLGTWPFYLAGLLQQLELGIMRGVYSHSGCSAWLVSSGSFDLEPIALANYLSWHPYGQNSNGKFGFELESIRIETVSYLTHWQHAEDNRSLGSLRKQWIS